MLIKLLDRIRELSGLALQERFLDHHCITDSKETPPRAIVQQLEIRRQCLSPASGIRKLLWEVLAPAGPAPRERMTSPDPPHPHFSLLCLQASHECG